MSASGKTNRKRKVASKATKGITRSRRSAKTGPNPRVAKRAPPVPDFRDPLAAVQAIMEKIPKLDIPKTPAFVAQLSEYRDQLITVVGTLSKELSPDRFQKLFGNDLVKVITRMSDTVEDISSTNMYSWIGDDLDAILKSGQKLIQSLETDKKKNVSIVSKKMNSLLDLPDAVAGYWGLRSSPVPTKQLRPAIDNLIPLLPGFVLKPLADGLGAVDITGLASVINRLDKGKNAPLTQKQLMAMAKASFGIRATRDVLKTIFAAFPVQVSLGGGVGASAGAEGNASLQAGLSAGVAVGVGATVPIAGAGGAMGAGGEGTALFELIGLKVSLTGLALGPFIVLCDFAYPMLDAIIESTKECPAYC